MIFGIQKRQWQLILLVLFVPLALNAVAIWQKMGKDVILQILRGTYSYLPYSGDFLDISKNPFLEISLNLLPTTLFLGLLSWFLIFISNRVVFQKQPHIVKLIEAVLLSLFVAMIFNTVVGFLMPLAWLPVLINTLGMPGSSFMWKWSRWLIQPITAIILFIAMLLSKTKKTDT